MQFEQEVASITKYVLDNTGNPAPYYYEVPQSFFVPAAYFPSPEMNSSGDTLHSYAVDYIWHILFFHKTKEDAYALARQALHSIRRDRNLIPLISETGELTGKGIRVDDPKVEMIDNGVAQLQISWTSRWPYSDTLSKPTMAQAVEIQIGNKGIYQSPSIDAETKAALQKYIDKEAED